MQNIIQRTSGGLHVISLDIENFDKRIVNIQGEITQDSAFEFALALQHLNSISETEPITVLVNSPGGSIDAGRYMLPNSKLMLHEPLLGFPIDGNTSSIKTISDDMLATRDKINTILAKHTGKTKAEIEAVTKHDQYFTAEESVKFGMADKVITFGELVKGVY